LGRDKEIRRCAGHERGKRSEAGRAAGGNGGYIYLYTPTYRYTHVYVDEDTNMGIKQNIKLRYAE
jgi:hypothetical protein